MDELNINNINIITQCWELMNESEEDSSSDEELQAVVSIVQGIKGQKPLRIQSYMSTTIPNITAEQFRMHFGLTLHTFESILALIEPSLKSNHPEGRPNVEPKQQLLSIIWLLVTPDSYRFVGERFDMAKSTLFKCFVRVISVLNEMAPTIIIWPSGIYAEEVKEGFSRTGLDLCLGMINGSYIPIKAPKKHPEVYICRKKFNAITLQAICDHRLKFTDCFVGYPASVNDYCIFKNSDIYKNIISNPQHYFPNDEYVIGDNAYPLKRWCIRPYINRGDLLQMQTHFNTQLSKVGQCIERSFALLKGRFRRLKYLDMNRVDMVPATILAYCVLHNICISGGDINEELIDDGHLNNINDIPNAEQLQIDEMVDEAFYNEKRHFGSKPFFCKDRN